FECLARGFEVLAVAEDGVEDGRVLQIAGHAHAGDRDEAESRVLELTLDRAGDDDLDLVGDLARPSRVCHGAFPLCRGRSVFSGPMVAGQSNRLRPIPSGTDRSRDRRPVSPGLRAANPDQSAGLPAIAQVSLAAPTRRSLNLPSPLPHP